MNKNEQMNSRPLMLLSNFKDPKRGMLIGFKSFSNEITAAYQLWKTEGTTVWFVLGYQQGTGKPILDATLADESGPFINIEPFQTEIEIATATTFGSELSKFFNR